MNVNISGMEICAGNSFKIPVLFVTVLNNSIYYNWFCRQKQLRFPSKRSLIYNYSQLFLNYILNFRDKLGKIIVLTKFYQFHVNDVHTEG